MLGLLFGLAIALAPMTTAAGAADFANPEPVDIEGYSGHVMEPFLSRDDRILMFNDSNAPGANTDLHWAERLGPLRFRYRGRIEGANSDKLDGVPSMDHNGNLYFVSLRSFEQSIASVYRGTFEDGRVRDVRLVEGLSRGQRGMINFDAEISADGDLIYAVDGEFKFGPVPWAADIFVARRIGARFERVPDSDHIMASINTSALEYAPAISADGLELCFTRMTGALLWRKLAVLCAARRSHHEPFGPPKVVEAISGFVEAPTFSSDRRSLYYHKKVDGLHRIWRVSRPWHAGDRQ